MVSQVVSYVELGCFDIHACPRFLQARQKLEKAGNGPMDTDDDEEDDEQVPMEAGGRAHSPLCSSSLDASSPTAGAAPAEDQAPPTVSSPAGAAPAEDQAPPTVSPPAGAAAAEHQAPLAQELRSSTKRARAESAASEEAESDDTKKRARTGSTTSEADVTNVVLDGISKIFDSMGGERPSDGVILNFCSHFTEARDTPGLRTLPCERYKQLAMEKGHEVQLLRSKLGDREGVDLFKCGGNEVLGAQAKEEKAKVERLEAERKAMAEKMEAERKAMEEKMEAKVEKMEAKVEKLEAERKDVAEKLEAEVAKIHKLELGFKDKAHELAQAEAKNATLLKKLKTQAAKTQEAEARAKKAGAANPQEAEARVKAAEDRAKKAEADKADAESKIDKLANDFNNELARARAMEEDLGKEQAKRKAAEADKEKLHGAIVHANGQVAIASEKAKAAEANLARAAGAAEAAKEDLRKEREAHKTTKNKLMTKDADAANKIKNAAKKSDKENKARLEEVKAKLEEAEKQHKARLEEVEKQYKAKLGQVTDATIAELSAELKQSKATIADLSAQLEQWKQARQRQENVGLGPCMEAGGRADAGFYQPDDDEIFSHSPPRSSSLDISSPADVAPAAAAGAAPAEHQTPPTVPPLAGAAAELPNSRERLRQANKKRWMEAREKYRNKENEEKEEKEEKEEEAEPLAYPDYLAPRYSSLGRSDCCCDACWPMAAAILEHIYQERLKAYRGETPEYGKVAMMPSAIAPHLACMQCVYEYSSGDFRVTKSQFEWITDSALPSWDQSSPLYSHRNLRVVANYADGQLRAMVLPPRSRGRYEDDDQEYIPSQSSEPDEGRK